MLKSPLVNAALVDTGRSRQAFVDGASITVGTNITKILNSNTSTISAQTITLPAAPLDQQEFELSTFGTITALTFQANAGQILGAGGQGGSGGASYVNSSQLSAYTKIKLYYEASTTIWRVLP